MSRVETAFLDEVASIHQLKEQIDRRIDFCGDYLESKHKFCLEQLEIAQRDSESIGYAKGEVLIMCMRAFLSGDFTELRSVVDNDDVKERTMQRLEDDAARSYFLNFICYAFSYFGQLDKAFSCVHECLHYGELAGDARAIGWGNYAAGVFNFDLKDYATAKRYFQYTYDHCDAPRLRYGKARSATGLASVHIQYGEFEAAEHFLQEAMVIYHDMEHLSGEARTLHELGSIAFRKNNFEAALAYHREALAARVSMTHTQGIITSNLEIGKSLFKLERYDEAEQYLLEALKMAEAMLTKAKAYQAHEFLSLLYKAKSEPWKALEHFEKFQRIREEVSGEQAANRIRQMQTRVETEKAEIERLRNVELKQAFDIIEEKNKSILDSIHYAQRIQRAMLPAEDEIREIFPEHFIFFQPRDVVSGDFYWTTQKNGLLFFAACDCTGHGVPGALMSMLSAALLNEIVNENSVTQPAKILHLLRDAIIRSLRQTGAEGENKDGLDIALCSYDKETRLLNFAGAQNSAWILHGSEWLELPADKQPIGIHAGELRPFTNHAITLEAGDVIYIFTDGFADQFGGPRGKKFKYRQLRDTLASIGSLSLREQKEELKKIFSEWRGPLEQVDDVLVMAVKVQ